MFSVEEKQLISKKIEEIIKATNHPELDIDNIRFSINIKGKESWSWADIVDPKTAEEKFGTKLINPWNEQTHEELEEKIPLLNIVNDVFGKEEEDE